MLFIFNCKTTNLSQYPESKQDQTALIVVGTISSTINEEHIDHSSIEPVVDKNQSVELVQEVQGKDRGLYESVHSDTVNAEAVEETKESREISKIEIVSVAKPSLTTINSTVNKEYYVQVGS